MSKKEDHSKARSLLADASLMPWVIHETPWGATEATIRTISGKLVAEVAFVDDARAIVDGLALLKKLTTEPV